MSYASFFLLREEFLRLLTTDGGTNDRRRKDFNQAIFSPEGRAVWTETDLDMVMAKFDKAVKLLSNPDAVVAKAADYASCSVCGARNERHRCMI